MRPAIITLIVSMLFMPVPLPLVHSLQSTKATTQITGTIRDVTGAVIPRAEITIEGEGGTYTGVSGEVGRYSITVPGGIYRIKITHPGFCPARRAAFRIDAAMIASFDFTLLVCPLVNRINLKTGEETCSYESPFKEDVYWPPTISPPSLDIIIQYGEQAQDKDTIQYSGYKHSFDYSDTGGIHKEEKWMKVIVTYNHLTIEADKVSFNKRSFEIKAEGNVVADDGKHRIQANSIAVTIRNGIPEIKAD